MSKQPKIIAIMGPTAAGKTALAIELVRQFDAEIISVDSAQVYRRLAIGSAKPSAAELAIAPHRLIDIRDPWERYSVAEFVDDAQAAIEEIVRSGRLPVLAGGTMLYFRALLEGLSEMPDADPALRRRIDTEARARGWPAMHGELAAADPTAADRIQPNDAQRIQRALEVFRLTGRPISELQAQRKTAGLDADVRKIVVSPSDRKLLHQRIETRFAAMLDAGLIEEVRELRAEPRISADSPAMRSVGYRQVWQYLDGEYDRTELRQRGVFATRQLAKRQLTWLRKELDASWFDPTEPEWQSKALAQIGHFLSESVC